MSKMEKKHSHQQDDNIIQFLVLTPPITLKETLKRITITKNADAFVLSWFENAGADCEVRAELQKEI